MSKLKKFRCIESDGIYPTVNVGTVVLARVLDEFYFEVEKVLDSAGSHRPFLLDGERFLIKGCVWEWEIVNE